MEKGGEEGRDEKGEEGDVRIEMIEGEEERVKEKRTREE